MRKLRTTDLFEAARLIKKANLRSEMQPILKLAAEKKGISSIEEIGIDGALAVIEILTEKKSEKAFYEFLAGPFEMNPEAVADLDIGELFPMLGQLAQENDLKVFTKALQGLIGR